MTTTSPAPSASDPAETTPAEAPGGLTRRAVVAGAGGVAAGGLLAACGGSPAPAPAPAAPAQPAPSAEAGASSGGSSSGGASSGGQELAKSTTIPVGGGTVFADKDVVVTQPNPGEFKAFSATCTHQGCKVSKVQDGTIDCPCHGSKFSISDGSVAHGPAQKPLATKSVSVSGDSIVLA
jgi:Rieske Fe-S protein